MLSTPLSAAAALAARLAWGAVAATIGGLLAGALAGNPGWGGPLALLAFGLLAAARPADALLALAALGPLATVVLVLTGAPGLPLAEGVTLAFVAGWMLRQALRPEPLGASPWLRWGALGLMAAAGTSALVYVAVLLVEEPGITAAALLRDYVFSRNPVSGAVFLVGCLLLLLAVADLCTRRPGLRDDVLRMMVYGAAAAALLNLLRFWFLAVQAESPVWSFLDYLLHHRVNVHDSDLNAAGSYFAMVLLIAAGFAGRAPVFAAVSGSLLAAGLWATGSRSALLAAVVVTAVTGLMALRGVGRRPRVAIIGMLLLVAALSGLAWMWYPQERNAAGSWSLATRVELGRAALEMTASDPLFGVGLGNYYVLSNRYVGRMLASQDKERENAHNYFLQMLAELGISGLVLFMGVVCLALWPAWRAAGGPGPPWGLLAGLSAFLLTLLTGHALLVPWAAFPFWVGLGVAASYGAAPGAVGRQPLAAAMVVVLFFAVTLPFRAAKATAQADRQQITTGLSGWQRAPDGSRYRWAAARSSFHVFWSPRAVRLPIRHGGNDEEELHVRILLDGRLADIILVPPDGQWRSVRIVLPHRTQGRFMRLDLEVVGSTSLADIGPPGPNRGVLMVGTPVYE
jgi:O-antigen ligase